MFPHFVQVANQRMKKFPNAVAQQTDPLGWIDYHEEFDLVVSYQGALSASSGYKEEDMIEIVYALLGAINACREGGSVIVAARDRVGEALMRPFLLLGFVATFEAKGLRFLLLLAVTALICDGREGLASLAWLGAASGLGARRLWSASVMLPAMLPSLFQMWACKKMQDYHADLLKQAGLVDVKVTRVPSRVTFESCSSKRRWPLLPNIRHFPGSVVICEGTKRTTRHRSIPVEKAKSRGGPKWEETSSLENETNGVGDDEEEDCDEEDLFATTSA